MEFRIRPHALLVTAFIVAFTHGSTAQPRELSLSEVRALIERHDEDIVLVDARSPDAFMGWALDGVARGGHLPGSVNFAARWLKIQGANDGTKLQEVLAQKGITSERRVIVCDVTGAHRCALAAWLEERGFEKVAVFDLDAWAGEAELPLVVYPNHHWLVPPVVARAILNGQRPATFEAVANIKFAEVSWGKAEVSYDKGHLRGSFHIDTNAIEPPPLWELAPAERLEAFALAHGITCRDTILLSGADPMASFRLAVVLRYMGVRDVRVLHGGIAAWTAAGFVLETRRHQPVPVPSFGCPIPGRPELIDSITALKARQNPDFTLVDNRTWEEHIGETSGYASHNKKGRIPGCVFGRAGSQGPSSMDHYRNPDHTMRSPRAILGMWEALGINPDKHLSFMCGGGWRAAEVLTYAQVMGFKKVSLYSDGWLGWSRDPKNPVATGVPGKGTDPIRR